MDAAGPDGAAPLHVAARHGHAGACEALCEVAPDPAYGQSNTGLKLVIYWSQIGNTLVKQWSNTVCDAYAR